MKFISGLAPLMLLIAIAPQWGFANVCVYRPPNLRQVHGKVLDTTDQAIPSAVVMIKHGKKTVESATTDQNGSFRIDSLQDGEYELIVDAVGFQRGAYLVKLSHQTKHWTRALQIKLAVGSYQCEGGIEVIKQASSQ